MPKTATAKKKKGRTKYNRQWVKQHKAHRARLFYGDTDKLTGQKL